MPGVRIKFYYELFNEQNELVNIGDATLVFINDKTRRPRKPPKDFINKISEYCK